MVKILAFQIYFIFIKTKYSILEFFFSNIYYKNKPAKKKSSKKSKSRSTAYKFSVHVKKPKSSKKSLKKSSKKSSKKSKSKSIKQSSWNVHMMKVYREMKKNNPNIKLGDAMKAAKKTYKKK